MAEQDDPSTLGNIKLAISQALFAARNITVGRVVAYRELPPNKYPVVDIQIAPRLLSRPVDGGPSVETEIKVVRNCPLGFFQLGDFTISTRAKKDDHVICLVGDRELSSWMRGDGGTYKPAIPGQAHNINDIIALPFLTPNQFQPQARPGTRQLLIGDKTGQLATIKLNAGSGGGVEITAASQVTVTAPVVNVEGSQVNIGKSTGAPIAPIARVGIDFVVVPPGVAGGSFPIIPGPIVLPVASAHLVKG